MLNKHLLIGASLALALGSGGARGWCHIGVLRELDAMGVRPDVIAGASMGAVVGAVHAGGDGAAHMCGVVRIEGCDLFRVEARPGGLPFQNHCWNFHLISHR